jgi:hypothetical protein
VYPGIGLSLSDVTTTVGERAEAGCVSTLVATLLFGSLDATMHCEFLATATKWCVAGWACTAISVVVTAWIEMLAARSATVFSKPNGQETLRAR